MPLYFERSGQITTVARARQDVLFAARAARFLRLTLLEGDGLHSWSIGELGVFGRGPEGVAFVEPEFADPTSPELAERRLRLQSLREPESDRSLVELARLYRSLGEAEKAREIERLDAERFRPQVRLDWRFGRDLKLLGYDWRALGPRRVEITYYWQAMRSMDDEYASYVRLAPPGTNRCKTIPCSGRPHTTAHWLAGEIVKDRRALTLAAGRNLRTHSSASGSRARGGTPGSAAGGAPARRRFCRIVAAGDSMTVGTVQ